MHVLCYSAVPLRTAAPFLACGGSIRYRDKPKDKKNERKSFSN